MAPKQDKKCHAKRQVQVLLWREDHRVGGVGIDVPVILRAVTWPLMV